MRYIKMLFVLIVLVFCASAALVACEGNVEDPAGPLQQDAEPDIGVANQTLGLLSYCTNHPNRPVCRFLCNHYPSLPFCEDEGTVCNDEEDPNYEPCPEGTQCYFNECAPTADPGDCIERDDPCDPNGPNECCHDVVNVPSSPQDVCEDPFGEGPICLPAP